MKCRVCNQQFDINTLTPDKWIMPAKNWYYHRECYDNWLRTRNDRTVDAILSEKDWYAKMLDYLWRDVKLPGIDFAKIQSQWDHDLKSKNPKMTAKGIYFAVIYYYDYMHGDKEKALGGIGIVPSIYSDAASFWFNMNEKQQGIMDLIANQKEQIRQQRIIQAKKQENKIVPKFSLDEVE